MTTPLRIVFFGTPHAACAVLESIVKSSHKVIAVITQPDKRRGRGNELLPTPVKEFALEKSIEVYTPTSKVELQNIVKKLNADVGVVAAYGRILPNDVLEKFRFGCLNVHYSLLPRWRGAAPIERAILAGDKVTGISIIKLTQGLDEGPIFASRQFDLTLTSNSETVYSAMNDITGDLLVLVLDSLEGQDPYDQEGEPTYAAKLESQDFYFDSKTSVVDIDRKVRAGVFVKGAHTKSNGEVFRIIEAGRPLSETSDQSIGTIDKEGNLYCKDGTLVIEKVQVPGKPVMVYKDWANGVAPDKFPLKISD